MENTKINIADKKAEAITRMRMLGIFKDTIDQFDKYDLVSISEPPFGAFYWAEGEDLEQIRKFEEEKNALVYVVVRTRTTEGILDSYLYISNYPEEWHMDRADIENPDAPMMSYVRNHAAPECSELGFIKVERTIAGGLRRVL